MRKEWKVTDVIQALRNPTTWQNQEFLRKKRYEDELNDEVIFNLAVGSFEPRVKRWLARRLWQLPSHRHSDHLEQAFDHLAAHPHAAVRLPLTKALWFRQEKTSLLKQMIFDPVAAVRLCALDGLARRLPPDEVRTVYHLLAADPNKAVQRRATQLARRLSHFGTR